MEKRRQAPLDFIKNPDLIDSIFSDLETRKLTVVIKNKLEDGTPTKASHVFHSLPSGFCNKSETGFGATTSEIYAERNSIIVEPVRFTALSKQKKYDGHYYGVIPGKAKSRRMKEQLKHYLRDNACYPKKIFCVIDRLQEVMETVSSPEFKSLKIQLFIDEIDSVQLESTYRDAMHTGIEIYKSFTPEQRIGVTATFLEFTDPELAFEPLTEIRYSEKEPRNLSVIKTNCLVQGTAEKIQSILATTTEKILVAINHFDTIHEIIMSLDLVRADITPNEIKILASQDSKDSAGPYYDEMVDGILPGRVTFMTSAFYTGHDVEEKCYFIMLASFKHDAFCISVRDYLQASGRLRHGLFAEILIMQTGVSRKPYIAEKFGLINNAKEQLDLLQKAFDLTSKSVFQRDRVLESQRAFSRIFSEDGRQLLFELPKGHFKISYLTIDALLEKSRVHRDLYIKEGGLLKSLEESGWNVTVSTTPHFEDIKRKGENIPLEVKLQKATNTLWDAAKNGHWVELDYVNNCSLEKRIFGLFNKYFSHFGLDHLVRMIIRTFRSLKDDAPTHKSGVTKQLKTLEKRLWFATLPSDHQLKSTVEREIIPGSTYERAYLEHLLTNALAQVGIKTEKWLNILRAIFEVTHVKGQPSKIKIVARRIRPDQVKVGCRSFF